MSFLRKYLIVSGIISFTLISSILPVHAELNMIGILTGEGVNVRQSASTNSEVLAQVSEDSAVVVIDSEGDWYKVLCNDEEGWIHSDYISTRDPISGVVTGDSVNIRSGSSTSSKIITRVNKGESLNIFGRSGDWYKIQTPDDTYGWISGQYVSVRDSAGSSRGAEDIPDITNVNSTKTSDQVIEYAKKFLGVRYVYGGNSPSGFDCSGYVKYVFNNFGINLTRVAAGQANQGTAVNKSELRPGDLVFFDTDGGRNYINHVGIYIGNGNFIHASSGRSTHRVTISNLNDGFYAGAYMRARRVLN